MIWLSQTETEVVTETRSSSVTSAGTSCEERQREQITSPTGYEPLKETTGYEPFDRENRLRAV